MLLPLSVSRCCESKTEVGVGILEILEAGVGVGSKSSDSATLIKIAMVQFYFD